MTQEHESNPNVDTGITPQDYDEAIAAKERDEKGNEDEEPAPPEGPDEHSVQ